jgi:hypothetical protein
VLNELFRTSLTRPWKLLFMEPIVILLTIYMAISSSCAHTKCRGTIN